MRVTTRVVAEGASRFRRPSLVERLADRFGRVPIRPSVRRRLKKLYQLALAVQTGGRGLPRELPGGEIVRVLPNCEYLSWNPDEYHAFRDVVKPGMVVLDIGANVGAYSMLLGRWVGPSGRVFAFEPSPEPFQGLVRHVRLNDLSGTVTPICAAVGSTSSTGRLLFGDGIGESRLVASSDDHRPTIAVTTTTIDEFCAKERISPDFIKIDVEGGELAALQGARETIRERRGNLALFVEMHASIWPAIGINLKDIQAELHRQSLGAQSLTPAADIWALEGICLRLVGI